MSINCNIYLPLHVKSEHALYVIGKAIGVPYEQTTFSDTVRRNGKNVKIFPAFNPDLPASDENSWHIDFGYEFKPIPTQRTHEILNFNFQDIALQNYSWLFFQETEYEDCKLINPGSNVTAAAIGKKLIDFFGGYLAYNDSKDLEDNELYQNMSPSFPIKTSEQEGNSRWHQFYNALNQVKLLTTRDLDAVKEEAAYFTERDKILYDYLLKYEDYQRLEQKITHKENIITKKIKI